MFAVGLDISADFFTASCVDQNFKTLFNQNFHQNVSGWDTFLQYLAEQGIYAENCQICMESTGVYSEKISYFLYNQGFQVFVEPPSKIKRAFYDEEKDDPIDARQISEYLFRFPDKLHRWQPKSEIVYQVEALLTTREQLIRLQTACKNSIKSLHRKHHRQGELMDVFIDLSDDLHLRIITIEKEMEDLIHTNPELWQKTQNIIKITNVGKLLCYNLIVITDGYTQMRKYTSLARYLGIAPLKHSSGTSVKRRRRSDGAGPTRMRKLIYLATMRLRRNHPDFQKYYERKKAEGKDGRLILNNIANKLLKLICGVLKSGKPYIEDYKSLPPNF